MHLAEHTAASDWSAKFSRAV